MKSYKMSHFYRKVTAFTLLLLLSMSLFFPFTIQAKDGERTITLKFSYQGFYGSLKNSDWNWIYNLTGEGKFVVCSYRFRHDTDEKNGSYSMVYRVFSDKPFTAEFSYSGHAGTFNSVSVTNYKDIYYISNGIVGGLTPVFQGQILSETWSGFANLEVVSSLEDIPSAEEIIDSGILDLTKDNYTDPDPDTDGTLSNSIPTPKIHVNKDYSFGFDNCTDDYYIQLQGRFWSVDDIELYKENMMWKYRYSSSIKGDLNDWYTAGSKTKANSENLSFLENGQACFDSFLQQHPVSERNFYGGTNAVGNYFSGYNNALDTIKMLLGQPTSGYNGVDVYVRYFTYTDTGELIYGKWCHYYDDIAKNGSSGSDWDDDDTLHSIHQSESGLTDYEKDENEKNDDPRKSDLDVTVSGTESDYKYPGINIDFDSDLNFWTALNSFFNVLNSLVTMLGDFPAFVSAVFGFLPSSVIVIISLGIISVVILRFVGR